jgi:hypothetical protein
MFNKLFNPFKFIAGSKSLVVGLIIIVSTSIVGYFSHTHFPDVISVKIGFEMPITYFLFQGLLNWLVLSTVFYIAAVVFSKSSIRIIDIYGTQAFARAPYFLAAFTGFSNSLNNFGKYILWAMLQQGESIHLSAFEIALAILVLLTTVLLTVWMITLMFNAFKVSSNIKGTKLILIFISGLLISIIITYYSTTILIKNIY